MNPIRSAALAPSSIGSPFEGGYFGGVIRLADKLFAVAWAPKAEGETKGPWSSTRKAVPGADSCSDSLVNTLAMAEADCPLAKWALALRIGGHDDWCLPARDVLELAYRHLKPTARETAFTFRDGDNPTSVPAGYPYTKGTVQTSVALFQEGGAEAFAPVWYWSSTQYSDAGAWIQGFGDGYQNYYDKTYEGSARAVRLIQLDS